MEDIIKKHLNVASITGLWNTYMNDSAAICMFKYFLNHVDDKDTKKILQHALNLSEQHIKEIKIVFNKENIPIPDAFGEEDVDIDAPCLFTDSFYLFYLATMAGYGMDGFTLVIRNTAREDIQDFYVKCLNEATDLLIRVSFIQRSKGIYLNAPRVDVSPKITYIEKDSFFKGLLGEKRPLLAREATNIFAAEQLDIFWRALFTGFGQVAISTEVKDFMFKGRDIASEHFEKFSKILNDENIPVPSISDSFVLVSTVSPFSDKLMMFHALSICALLIGFDGVAVASSMRSDLLATHTKFGAEILNYSSKGIEIMVNNRWMEQPPQVLRHETLVPV